MPVNNLHLKTWVYRFVKNSCLIDGFQVGWIMFPLYYIMQF